MTTQNSNDANTKSDHSIQSAPAVATLSPEERKRRYAELRKKLGKPRSEVKGRPGKHYFWAAADDSSELARLDVLGYEIVREPDPKGVMNGKVKPKIEAAGLREDGTYRLGDTILLEVDQEVYDFILLDAEERHEQFIRSAKENFISEAAKIGAPTFEV